MRRLAVLLGRKPDDGAHFDEAGAVDKVSAGQSRIVNRFDTDWACVVIRHEPASNPPFVALSVNLTLLAKGVTVDPQELTGALGTRSVIPQHGPELVKDRIDAGSLRHAVVG